MDRPLIARDAVTLARPIRAKEISPVDVVGGDLDGTAAIAPFRRLVVYPAIIRKVQSAWAERYGGESGSVPTKL